MRKLKLVRIAAGMSQVVLAAETDISQTRLSQLEREVGVSASTLFKPLPTPARRGAAPELV